MKYDLAKLMFDALEENKKIFIKESASKFQCNYNSLGWIDPDSKFHLLPSESITKPMSHEAWIEKNLKVSYSNWKESEESFGWIKVSSSTNFYSLGREYNHLDRIEVAKMFLHCMYNFNNLGYLHYLLKSDVNSKFLFAIKKSDDNYSYPEISFFDFFDKIAKESELGSKLMNVFYKMINFDIYGGKPLELEDGELSSFAQPFSED